MGETEPPPTVHPRGQPISGSERNISLPWNRGRFDGAFRPRSGRNLWRRPRRDPREGIPPPGSPSRGAVSPQLSTGARIQLQAVLLRETSVAVTDSPELQNSNLAANGGRGAKAPLGQKRKASNCICLLIFGRTAMTCMFGQGLFLQGSQTSKRNLKKAFSKESSHLNW